ncbi:MAG TPA: class I SAM-dependent methyltransferase [Acidimicrobiales bacterium]
MTATTAVRPANRRRDRRARLFARFWSSFEGPIDELLHDRKRTLFLDLPDEIVEIGPGLGSTFRYLRPGTRVLAFEPNPYFHEKLRAAAAEHDIDLRLHGGDLRDGRLPDASQEVVVSSLVLCSVGDVADTLAEITRVLRPGGRLLFLEHVDEPRGIRAAYQRVIRRPWRYLGDGCDTRPGTVGHLVGSGLEVTTALLEPVGSRLDPTRLLYWGCATKPVGAVNRC